MNTSRRTASRARFRILSILLVVTIGFCLYILFFRPGEEKMSKPMVESQFVASDTDWANWTNFIKSHCERIKGSNAYDSILAEEYQIYSVVIDHYRTDGLIQSKPLTMSNAVDGVCGEPRKFLLKEDFVQSKNIQAVSGIEEIPDHREYHSSVGIVILTRVAFNENHSEARMSFQYTCGSLCGFGKFLTLKNIDNQWIIDHNAALAASDVMY